MYASLLQALDSSDPIEKILRSLSFYSVTNLEAFIFCYAGEYVTNKVSDNHRRRLTISITGFLVKPSVIFTVVEQRDRIRCVQDRLV